jgi:hypothetical protein
MPWKCVSFVSKPGIVGLAVAAFAVVVGIGLPLVSNPGIGGLVDMER